MWYFLILQTPDPGWTPHCFTPGRYGEQDPSPEGAVQYSSGVPGQAGPVRFTRSAHTSVTCASDASSLKAENLIVSSPIFTHSDTTVTVSIATVPNYPPVKTEVPTHGFSVTVPNNCAETDGAHVGVFDRQLTHNTVPFSPSTQSRTPPDSTFPESFKDGSQEVSVSVPFSLNPRRRSPYNLLLLPSPSSPPLFSLNFSFRQWDIHLIPWSQRWAQSSLVLFEHAKIAASVLLCHCLTNTIKCCTFLLQ